MSESKYEIRFKPSSHGRVEASVWVYGGIPYPAYGTGDTELEALKDLTVSLLLDKEHEEEIKSVIRKFLGFRE